MKSWMISNGITPMPITINEYSGPDEATLPGRLVWYWASLEKSAVNGVIAAARACWTDDDTQNTYLAGRLDGIMTSSTPHRPRASWHLYKAYADMTGNMVNVEPGIVVAGIASLDTSNGEVKILLGNETNQSTSTNLTINNLDQISYVPASGAARVVVQRVSDSGWAEVSSPETVSDSIYQLTGNSLTLPLTFAANQAYIVSLKYPCTFKADLNSDCIVDWLDLDILVSNWLR